LWNGAALEDHSIVVYKLNMVQFAAAANAISIAEHSKIGKVQGQPFVVEELKKAILSFMRINND
jgi:hypothetical protein